MVGVKVGIDHVAHRLGGNFPLHLAYQRSGSRWLGVRIHDDYVLGTDEYGGVAVQHGLRMGTRKVNAVGNLLNVEEVGLGTGSRRASPGSSMPGQLQNRGPGQGAPHQDTKEVAARGGSVHDMVVWVGMMAMGMAVMTRGFSMLRYPLSD